MHFSLGFLCTAITLDIHPGVGFLDKHLSPLSNQRVEITYSLAIHTALLPMQLGCTRSAALSHNWQIPSLKTSNFRARTTHALVTFSRSNPPGSTRLERAHWEEIPHVTFLSEPCGRRPVTPREALLGHEISKHAKTAPSYAGSISSGPIELLEWAHE